MQSEKTVVDESCFGGNASAEGADADEGGEDVVVSGIDIALANRYAQLLSLLTLIIC